MAKDYYASLGVDKSASQDEIKKAFRKKAHKFHPDKPTGDEAKFKEVNEAYQVLGDENKRKQYDQFGAGFEQQGGFGGGMNWNDFMNATRGQGGFQGNFAGADFGDIFGEMFGFGGGRRGRGQAKGRDVQVDVEISLHEAAFGMEKEISLTKNNACAVCTGTGAEPGSKLNTCSTCDGKGQVVRVQQTILGPMQSAQTCGDCRGAGQKPEKACKHCNGSGKEKSNTTLNVKIPAGIHNGSSIRLREKGEYAGAGTVAGDLFVVIHVRPEEGLQREGDDIYSNLTISFPQAALGDTVEVKTLDGMKKIVVPAGTQPGQKIRLKGFGTERLRGHGRGDQYVQVMVEVPKKLNKKAKKAVEELREHL